tara:strand:- start:4124 stop:4981 length:858 start_codon:yes stop_codon:yes gene_type:complete
MEIIMNLFYKFLKAIDYIIKKIFKKEFLLYLKVLIENNSYKKIKILDKMITFFIPNQLVNWRVDTFFSKEPETLKWIDGFKTKEKIIFWDIGSNIGLYSIYASLKHKNAKVISFEPSTSNLRILSRNISINRLEDKITICQLPLNESSFKFEKMNESNFLEGFSENTFGKAMNFEGKKMIVKNNYNILGSSIDHLVTKDILSCPNYIKIDVDGIEHLILNGATNTLSDKRLRSVLVEINENFNEQYTSVMKIMENSNFKLKTKSHADEFYKGNQSKIYNFIFEKK